MKRVLPLLAAAALSSWATAAAECQIPVFKSVTFYDGYLVSNIPADAPDEGCTRLYTYLVTRRLTDDELNLIGDSLRLDVQAIPQCDNYDRIGSVHLALVPKGQESYTVTYRPADDPMRVELARFITPFMNRHLQPYLVPYSWDITNVAHILRDSRLRADYDFWLELQIFGVPYAAHTQIDGCSGHNDVYQGCLQLVTTDEPAPPVDTNVFVPVTIRTADHRGDRGINNYNAACTDQVGTTVKTFTYEVPEDCNDGWLYLIMSNHGAGAGGEEYNRRMHYIYCDDELSLFFKPGRESCEPFRQYNTQANGIYGAKPQSDQSWQSFSNWCPGDKIDIRPIHLGAVAKGTHTVRVEVPDAVFNGSDGYFPTSIYFQGDTRGQVPSGVERPVCDDDYVSELHYGPDALRVTAPDEVELLELYDTGGHLVAYSLTDTLPTASLARGVYLLVANIRGLRPEVRKVGI